MSTQGTTTRVLPGSGGEYGLGTYAKGSSDQLSLQASFPSSPLMGTSVTVTADTQIAEMQDVMDGDHSTNVDFGTINMDYGDHPDLAIDTQLSYLSEAGSTLTSGKGEGSSITANSGGGSPANAFVPTTASPNDGTTNASAQPATTAVGGHGGDLGTIDYSGTDVANYDIATGE